MKFDIDEFKRKLKKLWIFIKFNSVAIIFSLTLTIIGVVVGLVPGIGDATNLVIAIVNFIGTQILTLWRFKELVFV